MPTKAIDASGDDKPKVFDIAKPGSSTPPATSRPVIISRTGVNVDPMVSATPRPGAVPPAAPAVANVQAAVDANGPAEAGPAEGGPAQELLKTPDLAEAIKAIESEAAGATPPAVENAGTAKAASATHVDVIPSDKPAADAPKPTGSTRVIMPIRNETGAPKDEAPQADPADANNPAPPAASPAPAVDDPMDDAGKTDGQRAAVPAEDMAHIEDLIAKKTYFVPIGQHSGAGGSGNAVLTGILLGLIVLAGIVYVLDAGIVDIGYELPFDLIK